MTITPRLTTPVLIAAAGLLVTQACAQPSLLFDFDALPPRSGLPAAYSVGGLTAQFSAPNAPGRFYRVDSP